RTRSSQSESTNAWLGRRRNGSSCTRAMLLSSGSCASSSPSPNRLFASMYQARSKRSVPTESIVPPVRISPTLGRKPAIRKTLRLAVLTYPWMEGRTFHFRGPQASRHSIPRDMLDSDRLPATLEVSVPHAVVWSARCGGPQQDRRVSLGWLGAKLLRGDG